MASIESIIHSLSILKNKKEQGSLWLFELITNELPTNSEALLEYFSEIINQEIKDTPWLQAPHESFNLGEIEKDEKTLRECGLNLNSMHVKYNNHIYVVGDLVKRIAGLEKDIVYALYSFMKGEIKKIEIKNNIKMIKHFEQAGEYGSVNLPQAPMPSALEITSKEFQSGQTIVRKRPNYSKQKPSDYLKYFGEVPVLVNNVPLEKLILTKQEAETIALIDGEKKVRDILIASPMEIVNALNLIRYLEENKIVYYSQK